MRWPTYCSNGSPLTPSEVKRQSPHWLIGAGASASVGLAEATRHIIEGQ